jgi:excisionase family DNA binding protein
VTERLLTAREVADRLGLSVETVLRWAKRGRLPAIYLSSRAIRFPEDALDTWLDERATPRRGVLPTLPSAARPAPYSLASSVLPTDNDEET